MLPSSFTESCVGNGKEGHERGLLTRGIFRISIISKFSRISREWPDFPCFRCSGASLESLESLTNGPFAKDPFSKRQLSKRPLFRTPTRDTFFPFLSAVPCEFRRRYWQPLGRHSFAHGHSCILHLERSQAQPKNCHNPGRLVADFGWLVAISRQLVAIRRRLVAISRHWGLLVGPFRMTFGCLVFPMPGRDRENTGILWHWQIKGWA